LKKEILLKAQKSGKKAPPNKALVDSSRQKELRIIAAMSRRERYLVKNKKIDRVEICKLMGIGRSMLSRYLSVTSSIITPPIKSYISLFQSIMLADILGMSIDLKDGRDNTKTYKWDDEEVRLMGDPAYILRVLREQLDHERSINETLNGIISDQRNTISELKKAQAQRRAG